jgi:hypothetical protein
MHERPELVAKLQVGAGISGGAPLPMKSWSSLAKARAMAGAAFENGRWKKCPELRGAPAAIRAISSERGQHLVPSISRLAAHNRENGFALLRRRFIEDVGLKRPVAQMKSPGQW